MAPFSASLAAATAALAAVALPSSLAFSPIMQSTPAVVAKAPSSLALNALSSPDAIEAAVSGIGSNLMLSRVEEGDMGNFYKSTVIALLFGGGLIPAAIIANKSMFDTLTSKRPEKKDLSEMTNEQKRTNFDPTFGQADYVESSGASGPTLPLAPLLFAPEKIPVADVVAVVGRINDDVNAIADWRNLPSTRAENIINPENPPMWLPRATFKANIRKAKFAGWPVDSKGNPVGGEALRDAELGRVSKPNAQIGDAALDAVFDTWAWGANIATPDKVAKSLRAWKDDDDNFSLNKFQLSAVSGRAVTGIGALTFVVIQVVAYGSLFIAPALRTFLDIDIGLGELGTCDPETCVRLFN